jgi:hypothetical protein
MQKIGPGEDPIEGTVAHALEGMQEPQGHHFTGPETGLRVFGDKPCHD